MAGTELMRIANLNNMEVRVRCQREMTSCTGLALGDTAEIDVDAYSGTGRKFRGVVTEIANTASGLA